MRFLFYAINIWLTALVCSSSAGVSCFATNSAVNRPYESEKTLTNARSSAIQLCACFCNSNPGSLAKKKIPFLRNQIALQCCSPVQSKFSIDGSVLNEK